jgi:hypothetical protein
MGLRGDGVVWGWGLPRPSDSYQGAGFSSAVSTNALAPCNGAQLPERPGMIPSPESVAPRLGAWAARLKGVPLIRTAAAERGFVDAVIQPCDTRKKLI